MSLYVDIKYVGSIQHLLRNFKKKGDYLYNFSCPICGDSAKNKLKSRGYIYRHEDGLMFKCHNCGFVKGVGELFRHLDAEIYKQWVVDSYLEKHLPPPKDKKPDEKKLFKKKKDYAPLKPEIFVGCPSIDSLDPAHPARQYIEERMIPKDFWKELYWTDDFPAFVDKFCPDHEFELHKEGRILIPCMDRERRVFAVHGRSVTKNGQRYITVKAFEDAPKTYGIHRLAKMWQRIYVLEGAFDSMFFPNAIGLGGSDIPNSLPADRTVIVYDNEPRSKTTCAKIEKAIKKGRTVCIWPNTIKEKDVNSMVTKEGIKPDKIRGMVDQNIYKGLEAEWKFTAWRKDIDKEEKKECTNYSQKTP